ncbi:RNA polymerase sigma factor [Idiomarina ramblicola]|uniref:RNA polymerase subunit sigma-24 n=1 Tax=Idiomarina ramblicola TaxID=263724 RepID=A0A432Z5U1_9GAMM|nr:RNA polymerase sigma factor [Idiomarina ramblicola]RUO73256.1 RNA polymerase subunit sigma-24 [Idiomarina ramblicola]
MPGLSIQQQISLLYKQQSRRILATLIRLLGDFELAEEAMQEAFSAALKQWPAEGIPEKPRAWLISAGRFKAIDRLRKLKRQAAWADEFIEHTGDSFSLSTQDIDDDQLRLIFTCCHPALPEDARVALTLREVCGLTTEQVASAFLLKPTAIAQRIVRAKRKIREAGIPYEVPEKKQLPQRLNTVLQVIYLVFNEGYCASSGDNLVNSALMDEAIHLTRQLSHLLNTTEINGLLALMLFQSSRRAARTNEQGKLLRLDQQDRSLWNNQQIKEADRLLQDILPKPDMGPYTIQAAIAGLHADAPHYKDTNWREILAFYDLLIRIQNTPVVALNRAVALSMAFGPEEGLKAIKQLNHSGVLDNYHLLHASQADLHRQLKQFNQAAACYRRAIELSEQSAERHYLQQQLDKLNKP